MSFFDQPDPNDKPVFTSWLLCFGIAILIAAIGFLFFWPARSL